MVNFNQPLGRRRVLAQISAISLMGLTASAAASDVKGAARRKRVFITGSSTGLGQMAARLLVAKGTK